MKAGIAVASDVNNLAATLNSVCFNYVMASLLVRAMLVAALVSTVAAAAPEEDLEARAAAEEAARPRVTVTDADEIEQLARAEAAAKDHPDDPALRFELGRLLLRRGVDGDVASAERALGLLARAAEDKPSDPLVLAYYGSARLLEAKRARAFWRKGSIARSGLELLDRAVALDPGSVEVRFLRGRSAWAIPFFFGRVDQAAADLAWVAARAEDAVRRGEIPADMAAAAFFYHGVCRDDRNDPEGARTAWRNATLIAPGSHHARAAAERLGSP